MAILNPGYITLEMVEDEVDAAIQQLGPEVIRVRYNLEFEPGETPCINFRVVITDAASRPEVLGQVSRRIRQYLTYDLSPFDKWGLFPHYSFRNQSADAQRDHIDLEWV